jgi:hypothetical protein
MLTLYARHEPVDASDWPDFVAAFDTKAQLELAGKRDVQLYHDQEATQPAARYPWHYSNKPDRRFQHVTHNCARYALVWLPDLQPEGASR